MARWASLITRMAAKGETGVSGLKLLSCGSASMTRARFPSWAPSLLCTVMGLACQGPRFLESGFASSWSPVLCHDHHPLGPRS